MTDDMKQLPAPEGSRSREDWFFPLLVFFGAFTILLLLVMGAQPAAAPDDLTVADREAAALPDGSVGFVAPVDGAEVPATFPVAFEASGVDIEPAGEVREGAGHFHILINEPFVEPGQVIPSDETHRHYGDGSLATELTLEPGTYILRLQFADGAHQALEGDQYRDEITVTVVEAQ